MSEQNRDPALDGGDAEFDARAFGGDVDGPGLVSSAPAGGQPKEVKIQAPPPETKGLSKKGVAVMLLCGAGLVATITVGVTMVGDRVGEQAAAALTTASAGAVQAPQISALNTAAEQQNVAAGGQRTGAELLVAREGQAVQPDGRPSGAATGPSHREQYADWLERHHFDRLRARHVADEQARLASLIEETSGQGSAPSARAQAAAPAPAFAGAPGVYTGQPRPDRIPPELLAQLAQGQMQGQGQGRAGAGFAPPQQPPRQPGQQPGQQQDRSARMQAFADAQQDVGYLNQQVRERRPGHEVSAGSIIPAVMLTAINSDLPGAIVAQVRSDVFATHDFQTLLIPAGSRLIGRYSADIATGQQRVLVAWDELLFPSGRRISLEGMGATDGQGAAGMRDQVRTHFWRIWGNALLVSMIGVAAQQAQPQGATQDNTPASAQQAAAAATNSLNETAQQVLRRNLGMSPTLEIRPGHTFNVLVNQSISLPAYRD